MSNDNSTECVDVTNPDWKELNYKYDLSAKIGYNQAARQNDRQQYDYRLCGSTVDDSCCKCMKRKTCKDTGCKKRFEGKGIHYIQEEIFLLITCTLSKLKIHSFMILWSKPMGIHDSIS